MLEAISDIDNLPSDFIAAFLQDLPAAAHRAFPTADSVYRQIVKHLNSEKDFFSTERGAPARLASIQASKRIKLTSYLESVEVKMEPQRAAAASSPKGKEPQRAAAASSSKGKEPQRAAAASSSKGKEPQRAADSGKRPQGVSSKAPTAKKMRDDDDDRSPFNGSKWTHPRDKFDDSHLSAIDNNGVVCAASLGIDVGRTHFRAGAIQGNIVVSPDSMQASQYRLYGRILQQEHLRVLFPEKFFDDNGGFRILNAKLMCGTEDMEVIKTECVRGLDVSKEWVDNEIHTIFIGDLTREEVMARLLIDYLLNLMVAMSHKGFDLSGPMKIVVSRPSQWTLGYSNIIRRSVFIAVECIRRLLETRGMEGFVLSQPDQASIAVPDSIRLETEPTCAAVAYQKLHAGRWEESPLYSRHRGQSVIVDIGGESVDINVILVNKDGSIKVLSEIGTSKGGSYFDKLLANAMLDALYSDVSDAELRETYLQILMGAAEKLKMHRVQIASTREVSAFCSTSVTGLPHRETPSVLANAASVSCSRDFIDDIIKSYRKEIMGILETALENVVDWKEGQYYTLWEGGGSLLWNVFSEEVQSSRNLCSVAYSGACLLADDATTIKVYNKIDLYIGMLVSIMLAGKHSTFL
jgi:hypothetical protein